MGGGMPGTDGSHWNMRSVMYTEQFLPAGFAWVTVDVRGTGASQGTRPIDLHEVELNDTKIMAEWVVDQAWCNDKLFSTGISYDGMSALALASHQVPETMAIAPLFAPFDLMDELSHPGGLRCVGFTNEYGQFVRNLEHNTPGKANYPPLTKFLINLLVNGVRPVDNILQGMHEDAILQHGNNWDMLETHRKIMNRDDAAGPVQSIDEISIHKRTPGIVASKVEHLAVSSWYDSGSVLGAVRYYQSVLQKWTPESGLRHPRLLLGPWNHGARNNCSPFAKSDKPRFSLVSELVRFFTKGDDNDTFPVHYFTVGEEAWKASHVWPPPHRNVRLNIQAGPCLAFASSNDKNTSARSMEEEVAMKEKTASDLATVGYTTWDVDTSSTSGVISRWNLVKHILYHAITYPDRQEQDKHNLIIDSEPLGDSFEVTGHPSVTLYVKVDAQDAGIFVYLEEVFPNGRVVYVTEGQLRLAQRKMKPSHHSPYYCNVQPYRSFLKADCEPLQEQNTPVRAIIPFLPISYAFSAGSRIRLSLAVYDKDNFDPIHGPQPTVLTVIHGVSYLNLTHVPKAVLVSSDLTLS